MTNLNPFFQIFDQNRPFISFDSSKWPDSWKEIHFKSYPRLEKVNLPKPSLDNNTSLKQVILHRHSKRDFSDENLMNAQTLSNLLFYSAGIIYPKNYLDIKDKEDINLNTTRRAYPSGGARFPLEIYVFLFKCKDIKTGIYHYNVLDHSLEKVLGENVFGKEKLLEKMKNSFQKPLSEKTDAIFVMSSMIERSSIKYGNLSYKIAILEAGHIGQNIYLISDALGLKCCAHGDFNKDSVHNLLDIDGITETAFYALSVSN